MPGRWLVWQREGFEPTCNWQIRLVAFAALADSGISRADSGLSGDSVTPGVSQYATPATGAGLMRSTRESVISTC